MDGNDLTRLDRCPVMHGSTNRTRSNKEWWPNQLNIGILHQNTPAASPIQALIPSEVCRISVV